MKMKIYFNMVSPPARGPRRWEGSAPDLRTAGKAPKAPLRRGCAAGAGAAASMAA